MGYLLDTNTLSDYLRGDRSTMVRFKAERPSDIYFSAVTRFQIECELLHNPRLAEKIKPQLEEIYAKTETIPFGYHEASTATTIKAVLDNLAQPAHPYTLLIAATAATHNLTVVTSNIEKFSKVVALKVENWRDK